MTNQHDHMVGEYLDAVHRATVDLPPDRRDDLLADLTEHIATARAELDPETEAGVRDILERLGDPASIAAEARLGTPPSPVVPTGLAVPVKPPHTRRNVTLIVAGVVAAVLLLCCLAPAVALIAFSSTRVEHGTPAVPSVPQPSSTTG
jgi:uncharacterized membrane protein